jgi:hypothetical protein
MEHRHLRLSGWPASDDGPRSACRQERARLGGIAHTRLATAEDETRSPTADGRYVPPILAERQSNIIAKSIAVRSKEGIGTHARLGDRPLEVATAIFVNIPGSALSGHGRSTGWRSARTSAPQMRRRIFAGLIVWDADALAVLIRIAAAQGGQPQSGHSCMRTKSITSLWILPSAVYLKKPPKFSPFYHGQCELGQYWAITATEPGLALDSQFRIHRSGFRSTFCRAGLFTSQRPVSHDCPAEQRLLVAMGDLSPAVTRPSNPCRARSRREDALGSDPAFAKRNGASTCETP